MKANIRHRHYGFMLLTAALTVASLAAAAVPAQASAFAKIKPASLLPGSVRLSSVYCTASTNCWAVGLRASKNNPLLSQIVRWNGKTWTAVSAPIPGKTKKGNISQLFAVRCTSATNCWAVGSYVDTTTRSSLAQALHWTGKKWVTVPTPDPGGTNPGGFTALTDVACTSANNCWAVGSYGSEGITSKVARNLALHWTGKKWFKVTVPNPAGVKNGAVNSLAAIRCAAPNDCWAGGTSGVDSTISVRENEMLHWNGTKWSPRHVPSPGGSMPDAYNAISGLSCTSASNCWAVGTYGNDSGSDPRFLNQALRWNGHKWSQVTTPNPNGTAKNDDNELNGVTCSAANNCWAVGSLGGISNGGAETSEALHWTGTKWSLVKTPNPGGAADGDQTALSDVRCVSAKDCWAVGFSRKEPDPDRSLTLHWNGVKWSAN
ncbi:MAG TPA: hypothetical protein VFI65_14470 [Streptosporangiaceae bacterium]|nr:hypothetical protein [Streptosporangiaceae bacterium]